MPQGPLEFYHDADKNNKMSFFYRLRPVSLLLIALLLNPGPELFARNRKSDKIYKQAQAAEARKEYEQDTIAPGHS